MKVRAHMQIRIHGKQIDVGDALTSHCEDKLAEIVHKYTERPVEATVTFSKDRYEFVADVSVHLSTGCLLYTSDAADD